MFEAVKHGLWRGQPLSFAVRKISDGGSRNYEGGSNSLFLHNLTSLSSLFPDNFLSTLLITTQGGSCERDVRFLCLRKGGVESKDYFCSGFVCPWLFFFMYKNRYINAKINS